MQNQTNIKSEDKNSTMLIHINFGGNEGCLRIRPQWIFQVKQPLFTYAKHLPTPTYVKHLHKTSITGLDATLSS